ncbi:MAG: hypothetical protein GX217_02785 [Clostridiaceae bacterium]|nr:hypothetical protein [Clostridiaceae bacterium]
MRRRPLCYHIVIFPDDRVESHRDCHQRREYRKTAKEQPLQTTPSHGNVLLRYEHSVWSR